MGQAFFQYASLPRKPALCSHLAGAHLLSVARPLPSSVTPLETTLSPLVSQHSIGSIHGCSPSNKWPTEQLCWPDSALG